jgi:hypothetical protein
MARPRRTFGPLFYGTLVVAAIGLLVTGLARFEQWRNSEPRLARINLEADVAAFTSRLAAENPTARVASIRKLGGDLQRHGFALDAPAP